MPPIPAYIPKASYLVCSLCSGHIELEGANTDDEGNAVHEECYVAHVIQQTRTGLMFSPECRQFGIHLLDRET